MPQRRHLGPSPDPAEQGMERFGRHRPVPLGHEHVRGSRCRRRRAHISSPRSGWTLGEPFLALRTCRRPAANSTCDHANRTAPKPAVRAGSRSGSWWHPGDRNGSTSEPRPAQPCSVCRSTRQTLIRSRCRSANSKPSCEKSPSGRFVACAAGSAHSCQPSVAQNVATTSDMPATHPYDRTLL